MLDTNEVSCDRTIADALPADPFVLVLEPNYFAAEYQRRHAIFIAEIWDPAAVFLQSRRCPFLRRAAVADPYGVFARQRRILPQVVAHEHKPFRAALERDVPRAFAACVPPEAVRCSHLFEELLEDDVATRL